MTPYEIAPWIDMLTAKNIFIAAAILVFATAAAATIKYKSQTSAISFWGDSMTAGTIKGVSTPYPKALQRLAIKSFDLRTITNHGIEGMTSTQIASKFGAKSPMLMVDGQAIPESGKVAITSTSNSNLSSKSNYTTLKYDGTLGGVAGTLAVNWNEQAPELAGDTTFTRKKPGKAVTVTGEVPFVIDQSKWSENVTVIWSGRNDILSNASNESIIENIDLMIQSIKGNSHFLVLGVTDAAFESSESPGFKQIIDLNKSLSAAYPENWVDVRGALVDSYNPELPEDVAAYNAGKIAPSLFVDGLHLNDSGNNIVAKVVYTFIKSKGW
ncbi:SGNH/GDSL hydrolase family protein [Pseudomonas asplenii]|uniref:hypothetical protein n=1 Tax=Pseudomonas asplenii TaxID=53407 RepID=UPI002233E647|nr:hypothetical protein [Pseudomonas asplenii]UZE30323.1 hypothetical protein LOY63_06190 [Pseudomonas asplenii]